MLKKLETIFLWWAFFFPQKKKRRSHDDDGDDRDEKNCSGMVYYDVDSIHGSYEGPIRTSVSV